MRLAWNNLWHDRSRFAVAVLGIAFAVFLMIFQGSLLLSFLDASSRVIQTTDADLWITARGVSCFDFASPLPNRFVEIAQGVPGVLRASRIVSNFARFHSPDGHNQFVLLIGVEPEAGPLPMPTVTGSASVMEPDGVLIDRSHAQLLGVSRFPQEIEINRRKSKVLAQVDGFSSFLGSPYVFAAYPDAMRYLGTAPEETSFILARVAGGSNVAAVGDELRRRLPDVDVLTRQQFARKAQVYWITQTGAGGAILTAAILGFVIGLVVASQTIYATTMEHLEEYATLKALGASPWFVIRVVLSQALVCGFLGFLIGLMGTSPVVELVRGSIAWLTTPAWLPWLILPPGLLMCCLAALMSIRAALRVEPARVFRA
ncbi:MAG: ABC transporter permease [Acidobacteria bacterium]|nr:ABC transporter permease [Acidobacteriota bacterium]